MQAHTEIIKCREYLKNYLNESKNKPDSDVANALIVIMSDLMKELQVKILQEAQQTKKEFINGYDVLEIAKPVLQDYIEFIDENLADRDEIEETTKTLSI